MIFLFNKLWPYVKEIYVYFSGKMISVTFSFVLANWIIYFRYLIYKGGNVNIASNVDRKTALHVCSQYIYEESVVEELIAILIDSGANMNATCYQGSPLLYSIVVGKLLE